MIKYSLKKLFTRKYLVLLPLAYFLLINTLAFVQDINEGYHDNLHLFNEGLILLLTIVATSIVWKEIKAGYRNEKSLKKSIQRLDLDNLNYSKQVKILKHELFQVVSAQLEDWSLSKSEQEVAILLLKGLSLDEISQIRKTKEKTTRQQASAIYKKSNLKGRHELSAFFFEDLL